MNSLRFAGLALLAHATACSSPAPNPEPAPAPAAHVPQAVVTQTLEPYTCGGIENLHTLGGVFLASQPAPDDFRDAKVGGVRTVIDLRLPGEVTDFDEPAVVRELGLAYHNFGFKAPESLTDEVFDGVRALLNDPEARPILMHCSSANRVGAVWLAHRVLDGGLAWEAALEEAHTVGLRTPAFEERAKAYVDARASR